MTVSDTDEADYPIMTGADSLITKVGSDGLIAINSSGDLCTSSCSGDNVREYHYSGAETAVNNWIRFAGENWRIIGIFKGETSEGSNVWNMKIIREEALPAPSSTTYGTHTLAGTGTYSIGTGSHSNQTSYTAGQYYWNKPTSGTGYADWNNAGIKAYLNDESNTNSWYYKTFTSSSGTGYAYRNYIATTTYYLYTVNYKSTPINAYKQERNTDKNSTKYYEATWSGKIGLAYSSDWGYATDSSVWKNGASKTMYDYDGVSGIKTKNWILRANDSSGGYWLLSPSSGGSGYALTTDSFL